MFARIVSDKIYEYQEIIDYTINASIPVCEEHARSQIYEELLLNYADCWISYQYKNEEAIIKAMGITKIRDDPTVGGKVITVLCTAGFEHLTEEDAIEAFEVIKKFAMSYDCIRMDFYTENQRIIEYAKLFKLDRKCTYIQLSFV